MFKDADDLDEHLSYMIEDLESYVGDLESARTTIRMTGKTRKPRDSYERHFGTLPLSKIYKDLAASNYATIQKKFLRDQKDLMSKLESTISAYGLKESSAYSALVDGYLMEALPAHVSFLKNLVSGSMTGEWSLHCVDRSGDDREFLLDLSSDRFVLSEPGVRGVSSGRVVLSGQRSSGALDVAAFFKTMKSVIWNSL